MREDKLKFVEECSTESLAAVFDPEYASRLNCPLADHVLRSMLGELIRRGQELTPAMRDLLRGPDECEHGRSTSGTCGECDRPLHPRLVLLKGHANAERRREVLAEITNALLATSFQPYQLSEGGWDCPDPEAEVDVLRPLPPNSPTGHCVYGPHGEDCIFCGHPEERK